MQVLHNFKKRGKYIYKYIYHSTVLREFLHFGTPFIWKKEKKDNCKGYPFLYILDHFQRIIMQSYLHKYRQNPS